jgi:hypothetical protein
MKVHLILFASLLISLLVLGGCGGEKKMEPVPVGEMDAYKDPAIGFHVAYPKGWVVNAQVGRASFYNQPEVDKKFLDPQSAGIPGVEISVRMEKNEDAAGAAKKWRDDRTTEGFILQADQQLTVAGKPATKIPFEAHYDKSNVVWGHRIFIPLDSVLCELSFSGFGDRYATHAAIFEKVLASFELPKPVEKGRDATLPSESFNEYDAKMFTFLQPENFSYVERPKGKNDIVVGIRGVRQDCNILFDVFAAQGLTLEKVVNQNKGKYKGAVEGKATVAGLPAITLTMSATKDVDRRVYFAVRNDKVIRITMDWYKPQRAEYLAAYDKVISSIKFK